MIKFSHLADCHIGSWRDQKITELNMQSFAKAIEMSISEKVDFVLIAGDLFNMSMPSIEYVNKTVQQLMRLKEMGIPVYAIAGSHDFSPSGKTMLKVFESAGLIVNALQGKVVDGKLMLDPIVLPEKKVLITGLLGKKGTLERYYYDAVDYDDLYRKMHGKEDFFRIFMLHSALTELKPKDLVDMPSQPISILPKGFDYYCAGHVHYRFDSVVEGLGRVVYPGPTFPNNFKELSDLSTGSFSIVSVSEGKKMFVQSVPIKMKDVVYLKFDLSFKGPSEAKHIMEHEIDKHDIAGKIVLLKLKGKMDCGISEFNVKEIVDFCESKEPFTVMKNTFSLEGKEEDVIARDHGSLDEIEQKIVSDNFDDPETVLEIISRLSSEKREGETVPTYEERIVKDGAHVLDKITYTD